VIASSIFNAKAIRFIVCCMKTDEQTEKAPCGLTAFGIFLLWGAAMASLAAITLTWRGTVLDHVWSLNPAGYQQLVPFGSRAGILFAILGITLAAAGIGWLKRLVWAWSLAIAIIAAQVIGNIANVLLGRPLEGAVGITVSGAVLWYLLWGRVRAAFKKPAQVS
jgi:hypothetical protein